MSIDWTKIVDIKSMLGLAVFAGSGITRILTVMDPITDLLITILGLVGAFYSMLFFRQRYINERKQSEEGEDEN